MGEVVDDIDKQFEKAVGNFKEKETFEEQYEQKKEDFEANWKYGSTSVLKHEEVYYFVGDISHCGKEAIFFNASNEEIDFEEDEDSEDETEEPNVLCQSAKENEPEEDFDTMQLIKEHMSKKTAQELVNGIREGHPKPEIEAFKGDTWRFVYMDEITRRGKNLLVELGWACELDSVYVNLHTGSLQSVEEELNEYKQHNPNWDGVTNWEKLWSLVEHSEPYDETKPNKYLIEHAFSSEARKISSRTKSCY